MAETPNPPSSPAQTPPPAVPVVDPQALLATAIAVLKAPAEFYKAAKSETGFTKCLTFSVAMMVVAGVLAVLHALFYGWGFGFGISQLVGYVIGGFIGPFIGGLILWAICLAFGSKATYEPSVRIAAYAHVVSPIAAACMLVPWIGWLGGLVAWAYGIYIVVMGAKVLNFEPPPAAAPPSATV